MLTNLIEQIERTVLHMKPHRSVRFLNLSPPWAVEAMQRARFRRTLRLAAEHSTFYRDEFRRRGIDVRRIEHPSQLGDFYTTGEDLRTHGAEAFLTGRASTAYETTGTTSPIPKRVFFSQRELDEMGRASAIGLYHLGVRAEDRVLSAYDCSFWVSPAVLRMGLQYLNCFHVEAGKITPREFYERARVYKPNVIFGEPSWLVRLSELAREHGAWPVKLLFGGGENITEDARQIVESAWSAPLYLSYGQTESFGTLGAECERKDGYHRNDLFFIFETPETNDEGFGELVYTTLVRDVMPLIRYRSTDLTRLVDDPCACGLFAKRIAKIRSRTDEMVVCGMGNVGPWVFDELLRDVNGHGTEWQAVVTHDGSRDVVELRLEMEDFDHQAWVEQAVFTNLQNRFADFWKNHEMKLYDLRVAPYAPGSLRNGRKLKRVLDQREMTPAAPRVNQGIE
ncbi:MAG: phenylacetate-CoA ligase [Blastocatellia bacterium]|jgi:phenylacetate-CoA ligase|nr:phenylacetate-CoA ligase [Blastocatellia bacterium]